jgi:uncharacterized protein (PEP-CTERM system associated)
MPARHPVNDGAARRARAALGAAWGVAVYSLAVSAHGGEWQMGASIIGRVTLSDNIGLAPAGQEESDLVFEAIPVFRLSRQGARARLEASYAPSLYFYARNSDNNNVQQRLNAFGTVEAVENFFYVDARAYVSQTYISPFQPRPVDGSLLTNNRTQTTTLGLSPYIQGETPRGYRYLLRNDNTWTTTQGSQLVDEFDSRLLGNLDSPFYGSLGWGLDYDYRYTKFESQQSTYQQLVRARGIWQANPDLVLNARLGYETNDYTLESYEGAIYGAGVDWTPTPRTRLNGFVEHRFFGTSYGLDLDHRTRMTGWRLHASRDTRTYRDQVFTLSPGDLAVSTDAALQGSIADPLERQRAVDEFLLRSGLPPTLIAPYTFYTQQVYVAERIEGTATLFGVRNSIAFTLFWHDNEPVTATGASLPDVFNTTQDFRQQGGIVAATHQLSARTALTFSAQRTYASSKGATSTPENKSIEDTLRLTMTHRLTPKTLGTIGLRWMDFDSEPSPGFKEHALFAAVAHDF